eukprot:COSAG01_NODE_3317_length_6273_cov_4.748461_7_plen_77_part_00
MTQLQTNALGLEIARSTTAVKGGGGGGASGPPWCGGWVKLQTSKGVQLLEKVPRAAPPRVSTLRSVRQRPLDLSAD